MSDLYEICVALLFDDLVEVLRLRGFECRIVDIDFSSIYYKVYYVDVFVGGFRYRFSFGPSTFDDGVEVGGQRLWGIGEEVGGDEYWPEFVGIGLENPRCNGPGLCDCILRLVAERRVYINYYEVIIEELVAGLRGAGVRFVRWGDGWLVVWLPRGVVLFRVHYNSNNVYIDGKFYKKFDKHEMDCDMYWWRKGPDGVVYEIWQFCVSDYKAGEALDVLVNWDWCQFDGL